MPPRSSPPMDPYLKCSTISVWVSGRFGSKTEDTENAAIASTSSMRTIRRELRVILNGISLTEGSAKCNVPCRSALAAQKTAGSSDQNGSRSFLRDMNAIDWLDTFKQDIRYGARQLRRNPG